MNGLTLAVMELKSAADDNATTRDNVRAQLRVYVKRILREHGCPPDKQENATETVLEQAEVRSAEWTAS